MDYNMPGFPIFRCLLESAQTHVYWVYEAIRPYHLLSPAFPALIFPSVSVFSDLIGRCPIKNKLINLENQKQKKKK